MAKIFQKHRKKEEKFDGFSCHKCENFMQSRKYC